jgi:hypothetical protein
MLLDSVVAFVCLTLEIALAIDTVVGWLYRVLPAKAWLVARALNLHAFTYISYPNVRWEANVSFVSYFEISSARTYRASHCRGGTHGLD